MPQYTEDICEEDYTERVAILQTLNVVREELGYTQEAMSTAMGRGRFSVYSLQTRTTWRVQTIQEMARFLGLKLVMDIEDLPKPAMDAWTVIMASTHTSTPEEEDYIHFELVRHQLVQIRHAIGMSREDVSNKLNRKSGAIQWWEKSARNSTRICTIQRYARALGGRLHVHLEPA